MSLLECLQNLTCGMIISHSFPSSYFYALLANSIVYWQYVTPHEGALIEASHKLVTYEASYEVYYNCWFWYTIAVQAKPELKSEVALPVALAYHSLMYPDCRM